MRIAHLSAEVSPFAKTGGLGDVAGSLPVAQAELKNDVTVWMPLYRQARQEIARRHLRTEWVLDPFPVHLGFRSYEVGFLRVFLPGSLVPVYLVGSDPHFDRDHLYAFSPEGFDDGIVRYALFVRAALEAMVRLGLVPEILHAHDWHTALAPMILAWERDERFRHTAAVLTIHNLAYQGLYSPEAFVHLGLPRSAFSGWGVGWRGTVNLLKGGLLAASAITAVSPTFAREMMTLEGGFGLDPVIRYRADDLWGIVNGIDPNIWNPASDRLLPARFDRDHLKGKAECRRRLLELAHMDPDDTGMVVGVVGRLVYQKGYDLLFPVLDELLADGVRFVFLGSGERRIEEQLNEAARRAPGRFFCYVGFRDNLSHLIEAGADAFLMPSLFEPCGLNQLYSLAYGTPPIVRRVGGLADTVIGFDGSNEDKATGFAFDSPDAVALRETVRFAHRTFKNPGRWHNLIRNGMEKDFSWRRSAMAYFEVYRAARAKRG